MKLGSPTPKWGVRPPTLGDNSIEMLEEVEYSAERINELVERGVIVAPKG